MSVCSFSFLAAPSLFPFFLLSAILIDASAIPTTSKFEDYLEVINSLPDSETPETFGLPANIERSVQRANSSSVISQLKVLVWTHTHFIYQLKKTNT